MKKQFATVQRIQKAADRQDIIGLTTTMGGMTSGMMVLVGLIDPTFIVSAILMTTGGGFVLKSSSKLELVAAKRLKSNKAARPD